jgi:hypothetical protein
MANRHEFIAAHEGNCSAGAIVSSWASDPRAVELLRGIAISSAQLLIAHRLSNNLAEEHPAGGDPNAAFSAAAWKGKVCWVNWLCAI